MASNLCIRYISLVPETVPENGFAVTISSPLQDGTTERHDPFRRTTGRWTNTFTFTRAISLLRHKIGERVTVESKPKRRKPSLSVLGGGTSRRSKRLGVSCRRRPQYVYT